LHDPVVRVLDAVLLPLVTAFGRPATVAVVAVALAVFSMVGQRFLTDNHRLEVAKKRAGSLRREASKLPAGAPRRKAMEQLAAPVQMRLLAAALFPLLLVLGPMVMVFLWFPIRIDPASWNAEPGATIYLTAMVDGDYPGELTLHVPAELELEERTPATRQIVQIRPVLERLQSQYRASSAVPDDSPWELRAAALQTRERMLADLDRFLAVPMPARGVSWTLRAEAGQGGRFPIRLEVKDHAPVESAVVLGRAHAPEVKEDLGDGKGPIQLVRPGGESTHPVQWLKVAYKEHAVRGGKVFWDPVEWLVKPWLPGWLIVYLLAYLPAMFLLKWLLRVA
jgi:pyruvate,water dikinase